MTSGTLICRCSLLPIVCNRSLLAVTVILVGASSIATTAFASKCFSVVAYDLELESVEPAETPFPAATSEGWPIVWPEDSTLHLESNGSVHIIMDDEHVLASH